MLMLAEVDPGRFPNQTTSCRAGAVVYVSPDGPGLRRRRAGKGFAYYGVDGNRITGRRLIARIRALVIPPAWSEVWICPDPEGHIQAIGYDEKGRRQYRYHDRFRDQRESAKFEHMVAFAEALPALRARVAKDMKAPGLGREKVLATVVHLLETTMIRVGNTAYARENKSYGLTTLRNRHVTVDGAALRFDFKGKSGKVWRLDYHDRRVARIVRACQELPGQHLFQYLDEAGHRQAIGSGDVNAYLKAISGQDITAKDFGTWAGTVLAARALSGLERAANPAAAKRNLARAVKLTAERLGNTAAVCRKSYIHPGLQSAYLAGDLSLRTIGADRNDVNSGPDALLPDEAELLAFLCARCVTPQATSSGTDDKLVRGPWPGLDTTGPA